MCRKSSRKPRPGRLTKDQEAALVPGVLFTFQQVDRTPSFRPACSLASSHSMNSPTSPPPHRNSRRRLCESSAQRHLSVPRRGNSRGQTANQRRCGLRSGAPCGYTKAITAFRSRPRLADARYDALRLMWQAGTFAEEPVPPTAWFHDGQSEIARTADRRRRGRELIRDVPLCELSSVSPADEKSTQTVPCSEFEGAVRSSDKPLAGRVAARSSLHSPRRRDAGCSTRKSRPTGRRRRMPQLILLISRHSSSQERSSTKTWGAWRVIVSRRRPKMILGSGVRCTSPRRSFPQTH